MKIDQRIIDAITESLVETSEFQSKTLEDQLDTIDLIEDCIKMYLKLSDLQRTRESTDINN